jgi:adenylate cyclase
MDYKNKKNIEIERKFLIKKLPDNLDSYPKKKISQGYLNTSPVIRIRSEDNKYFLTYKGNGLIKHTEYNLPLDKISFDKLIQKCEGFIIYKTRYIIPLKGYPALKAELDVFEDTFKGLVIVEVEFEDEQSAGLFIPPDWFGEDVSLDKNYHNSNLSIKGSPCKTTDM